MITTLQRKNKTNDYEKLFTLVAFVVTLTTIAQSVAINTDGSADVSAILDLQSTTSGFLPPRMTAAQRDDIVNPVAGLQIWCSDCLPSGGIVVYSGVSGQIKQQ
jgi:hypothetical protein